MSNNTGTVEASRITLLENELLAARVKIFQLRRELRLQQGAIQAQDERERQAGAKCGVPYELFGCDWPDGAAEEIQRLRDVIARAHSECYFTGAGCVHLQGEAK